MTKSEITNELMEWSEEDTHFWGTIEDLIGIAEYGDWAVEMTHNVVHTLLKHMNADGAATPTDREDGEGASA